MGIKEKIINDLGLTFLEETDICSVPPNFEGDYSIPCFKLSKELKKSPIDISKEISETKECKGIISKLEAVGPYLNIFLNKEELAKLVVSNINENYGKSNIGEGKTICIDYSSITLSKQMHIGHLCTTVIGECLAKLYENFGYKVIRINYLGDMGTPFGKIITMYKLNSNKENIEKKGVKEIQKLYADFAVEEKNNPEIIEEARKWSLKIENKDEEATELCEWFKSIALNDANKIYDQLGINFDDWRGEAYYNEKTQEVVELLKDKKLLIESDGAVCVDLNAYNMGMYLIVKNDGGTLYSTRDLAAAIDRNKIYNFDKSLYVTGVEQKLHFASFFKVLELMGYDWAKNLIHIDYGRLSTEFGKISGREGNTPVVTEIFNASIEKSKKILENKNLPDNIAEAIGISAVVFSVLKTERIKDAVFSLDQAISFEGNSSVYLQYSDVRLKKVLKREKLLDNAQQYASNLKTDDEIKLLCKLDEFNETLLSALTKHEPYLISKYCLELATLINKFYNDNRIISDNIELTQARLLLCKMSSQVLEKAMSILGVKIIDEM